MKDEMNRTLGVKNDARVIVKVGAQICLMLLGILLNVLGYYLVRLLGLPLYFDCVGTVFGAVVGGCIPGVIIGYCSNAITTFSAPMMLYYGLISTLIALASAWMAHRGFLRNIRKVLLLILVLTFIGGGMGSVLSWCLSGFALADSETSKYAKWLCNHIDISFFGAQLCVDLVVDWIDKILTVVTVLLLLRFLPRKILDSLQYYNFGGIGKERNYRKHSLHTHIALLIGVTTLVVGLLSVWIGYTLYRDTNYIEQRQKVSSVAEIAAAQISGDWIEHCLKTGEKNKQYYEAERYLELLRSAFADVKFIYIHAIGKNDNQVIIDLAAPGVAADALGERIAADQDFSPYQEQFQAGKTVPAIFSHTEYGLMLTAASPIFNLDGTCVAYVFVDMAMETVVKDWIGYLVKMCSVLFGLLIVAASIVVSYIDFTTVRPLNALTAAASDYAYSLDHSGHNSRAPLEALNIHTGDEIEHLHQALLRTTHEIDVAVHNIEESKAKEAATKNLLKQILDNLPGGVSAKDPKNDFRYVIWNKQLEAHTGYKAEDVIGKTDFEIAPYPGLADFFRQKDLDVFTSGEPLQFEENCISANGGNYYYHTLKVLLATSSGMLIVDLCFDVTELKHLQKQLMEAMEAAKNANKAKSAFLATMSHEIRTPLNAVIGFSDLLQNTDIPPEERQEYLESIHFAGNALLTLINDILDLSKIESDQMRLEWRPVDLLEIAEEMRAIFRHKTSEQGIEFRTAFQVDLPVVEIDALRLRQILLNLIGNAVKYTNEGYVEFTIAFTPTTEHHGVLNIAVKDTGIGIPKESQDSIFQPFTQVDTERDSTVYKGTGLGLAIVSRLLDKMHGKLKLVSAENQGTAFFIQFNDIAYQPVKTETSKKVNNVSLDVVSAKCVLIVDDVPMNLKVLTAMLKKLNCSVLSATSGQEALGILAQQRPDLVLTDMWMAGMHGNELAAKIRKIDPELPVFAVTADTEMPAQQKENFTDVLLKPLTIDKLRAVIGRC